MSTTTVFESPTALGAKIITISTTITNTSGAYTATISDERLTASMKAIKLELGDPSVFDAVINIAVNNGSLTITCASVTGTSTAVISVLKTCDDPTAITTTEFDVLANRIGDLDDLETTAKTDLVGAVNEVAGSIAGTPEIVSNTNGLAFKYPSGLMICIKSVTASANCNIAWGSMYESEVISFGNWAVPFTNYPSIFITPVRFSGEMACWVEIVGNFSQSSAGESRMYRPTAASGNVRLHIMGVGYWK